MEQEQKQMQFEFCQSCWSYLLAADAVVVDRHSGPVVLCPNCADKEKPEAVESMDDTDRLAAEFSRKFNLPE